MNLLTKAEEYINKNRNKLNKEYRNIYHLMGEIGWINDPNGFIYYKEEYHLFYQHNPFETKAGNMFWGHAKSKDLVKWEYCPLAIAPDQDYDKNGCFSGTSIEYDDQLVLMYTGHSEDTLEESKIIREVQCLAYSSDGISFEKYENNPVISSLQLPENAKKEDFRDPKIWKKDNVYYCLVASKNQNGYGQLLLYKSKNIEQWEYIGTVLENKGNLGEMWECPDLFTINERDMIIVSPMYLETYNYKFENVFSSLYFIGKMNYDTKNFDIIDMDEIDSGFDFYAPQTTIDHHGRRIMVAWMQLWKRNIPTDDLKHGWTGSMTLPREITIENGKLIQRPMKEIEKYRKNSIGYKNLLLDGKKNLEKVNGQTIELACSVNLKDSKRFGIKLMKGIKEETILSYDCLRKVLSLDRSKSGEKIRSIEEEYSHIRHLKLELEKNLLDLRIFLDRSSIEIFINNGVHTMTSTVYPKEESNGIEFFSEGVVEIIYLKKWDINV